MVPPRTLKAASLGNGVRFRVSACRKRLRYSRTSQRSQVALEPDFLPAEIENCSIQTRDTPEPELAATNSTNSRKEA